MKYREIIEDNFRIIDKQGKSVPFILNPIQINYLQKSTGRDVILKARQQGFSSLSLAVFCADFILKENSYSVVIADNAGNAEGLLERVKYFLQSYEIKNDVEIPLKYNSKYEMHNDSMNSKYIIGTAENKEVARSKTITNLHLSEPAFYADFNKIRASALQAVTPDGKVIIESTANGFNEFKSFWDDSKRNETGFKPLFYKASDFYSQEFLQKKKKELGGLFSQEYPETDIEAFLSSGSLYFDRESLQQYLQEVENVQSIS